MEALRARFDAARARSAAVVGALTPDGLRREVTFIGWTQVTVQPTIATPPTTD